MYAILIRYCRPSLASFLTGLWYGLLLFLIAFAALEPQADFRYIEI